MPIVGKVIKLLQSALHNSPSNIHYFETQVLLRELSGKYPGNIRELSGNCSGTIRELSGKYPGTVRKISGNYPGTNCYAVPI